jgi:hypothetical protein
MKIRSPHFFSRQIDPEASGPAFAGLMALDRLPSTWSESIYVEPKDGGPNSASEHDLERDKFKVHPLESSVLRLSDESDIPAVSLPLQIRICADCWTAFDA